MVRCRLLTIALVTCVSTTASATIPTCALAQLSPSNVLAGPLGDRAGRTPRGWVMVVHGGAWAVVGPAAMRTAQPDVDFFRARGWGTYNVDYRAGAMSLPDVLSAYDHLRSLLRRGTPLCAWGASAGGNLVLLVAAHRPALRCVISQAGPTDLTTMASQPVWVPAGGDPFHAPRTIIDAVASDFFGWNDLGAWSPVMRASRIRARLLLGASSLDPLVPLAQMQEMRAALPGLTRTLLLEGTAATPLNFTHASVTPAALRAWHAAELEMLAGAAAGTSTATR